VTELVVSRSETLQVPVGLGLPKTALVWAIGAGAVIGAAYALSPLTVIVLLAFVPLVRWAAKDLPTDERRYVMSLLGLAIALRVAAVAWLFLAADRNAGSFATFFGDEEFFLLRGFRLYNVWMGIPISTESLLYAYDSTGFTSYQTLVTLLAILVGPAPYGVHLLNTLIFLTAAAWLYKQARRSYGPAAALFGLAIVVFLPSLFTWSVSELRESLFLALTTIALMAAVHVVRGRTFGIKLLSAATIGVSLYAIDGVRGGGFGMTLGGILLGYTVRIASVRRWIAGALMAAAVAAVVLVAKNGLPTALDAQIAQFAKYSRGHVLTAGHSYKLLDEIFYLEFPGPVYAPEMNAFERGRYIVRAIVNYVAQPVPWGILSASELLFMPEQVVWYLLVVLFVVGLWFAFKRDGLLTCILAGYAITNAVAIALNSGNIGTMVRHRALMIPFMVWMSAVGAVRMLAGKGSTTDAHR
jgi:hypothetical protein